MVLLNPAKPIAAFIEYTLKPLLDDAYELILLMEEKGFKKDDLKYAFWLFIIQIVVDFLKHIAITGLICWTIFYVLSRSNPILP